MLAVVGSAIAVELILDIIALNIAVEVMNALLLPLALGLLILLATRHCRRVSVSKEPTNGWSPSLPG